MMATAIAVVVWDVVASMQAAPWHASSRQPIRPAEAVGSP
jgi:hypothetical protein